MIHTGLSHYHMVVILAVMTSSNVNKTWRPMFKAFVASVWFKLELVLSVTLHKIIESHILKKPIFSCCCSFISVKLTKTNSAVTFFLSIAGLLTFFLISCSGCIKEITDKSKVIKGGVNNHNTDSATQWSMITGQRLWKIMFVLEVGNQQIGNSCAGRCQVTRAVKSHAEAGKSPSQSDFSLGLHVCVGPHQIPSQPVRDWE